MFFTFPCLICGDDCVPAPNERGWFSLNVAGHSRRVHFDCADWLKESADQIRNAPVLGEEKKMPNFTYHVQISATTMRQVEIESDAPLSEDEIEAQGVAEFKKRHGSAHSRVP